MILNVKVAGFFRSVKTEMHSASHVDHQKELHGFLLLFLHAVLFLYGFGASLGGPSGRRSSAVISTEEVG